MYLVSLAAEELVLLLLSPSVMYDSVQPHRRQPTRLPCPWDSPGKNTGVGCHFLLQCMKVKSESEVAQSCPTLSDPMDYSLPGSSVHEFSRQEYWSGLPLPSLTCTSRSLKLDVNIRKCPCNLYILSIHFFSIFDLCSIIY